MSAATFLVLALALAALAWRHRPRYVPGTCDCGWRHRL